MTAEEIITHVTNTALVGTHFGANPDDADNKAVLLFALNLGVNQIAQDALLWLGGETVTMVADTYEYTLSRIPVQIVDVYDDAQILRPRNNPDYFGYYQTAPNTIRFNNISVGTDVYVNYYLSPDEYILSDEVIVNKSLINSLTYFIASKAMENYKSEQDITLSKAFYLDYENSMVAFKSNTDSNNVDTVQNTDMIYNKGLV